MQYLKIGKEQYCKDDKMNIRTDTNVRVDISSANEKIEIYLAYVNLLLKYSRNKKISLPSGRLMSSNDNSHIYGFKIDSETYERLKNIRTDCKFEYEKKEYAYNIHTLEKDYLKIGIEDFPKIEMNKKGSINIDLRFIIKQQKEALDKLSLPEYEDWRNIIFENADIFGVYEPGCDFALPNINDNQKQAIQHAVGVKDVYLIWGPPGTGKTTIIPDIVRNYTRLQKEKGNPKPRVLVCSYTNTAVDNVVRKLFHEFKSSIVRFGKSTTLKDEYRTVCLEDIVKEESRELNDELKKKAAELNRNKKILEAKEKAYISKRDSINAKIGLSEDKKNGLEKEIKSLEFQKGQILCQLHRNYLEKSKTEIESKIMLICEKREKLKGRNSLILSQINREKSELPEIEIDILDHRNILRALHKREQDNANWIKIIEKYLEASKKNMMSAMLAKTKFKWGDPLYNRYIHEIKKLKLNKMRYRDLEFHYAKFFAEKDDIQKRTMNIRNELKELKERKEKKNHKMKEIKTEHELLKKEILELTERVKNDNVILENIKSRLNIERIELTNCELQQIDVMNNKEISNISHNLDEKSRLKENYCQELGALETQQKTLSDVIKKINKDIKDIVEVIEQKKSEVEEKKNLLYSQILQEHMITATTNLMTCHKKLQNITFDVVIMDESGAIDLLGAVTPLLKTKTPKFIFLGDPNQLPPVIVKNNREIENFLDEHPELEKSIFELFKERCPDENDESKFIMLKRQYRMKKEISDFVSSTFYDKKLECGVSENESVLKENGNLLLDSDHQMVCLLRSFYTEYKDHSGYCVGELNLIKNIIKNLKTAYGEDIIHKIAVLTPFRAQADKIKKENPDVECGTVHTLQGQQKEIIIYSTVKYQSNNDGTFGKLLASDKSKKLLNVAISRAMEKFIIIGYKELFNSVREYNELYRYIEDHGGINKEKLEGCDEQNSCKSCGKNIDNKYEYCRDCMILERIRTFLKDKPRTFKAKDSHLLRSSNEVRIDDWFYRNGIDHLVEEIVPTNKLMYYDWFLPKKDKFTQDIYVEYWGMMGDESYKENRKVKEKLYRKYGLTLLSIEPNDMKTLDEILEYKLRRYRISRIRDT